MNFTKILFADAIILLVEFSVLVLLELLGVRDEKLFSQYSAIIVFRCSSHRVFCDDHLSLFIKQGPNLCTGTAFSHGFPRSIGRDRQ